MNTDNFLMSKIVGTKFDKLTEEIIGSSTKYTIRLDMDSLKRYMRMQ